MATIPHKRGTTFRAALSFDGEVSVFSEITAKVSRGAWTQSLAVDHAGEAIAECTDDWPIALLRLTAMRTLPDGDKQAADDILINVRP